MANRRCLASLRRGLKKKTVTIRKAVFVFPTLSLFMCMSPSQLLTAAITSPIQGWGVHLMRITVAMAVACLSVGLSIADEAHAAIRKDTTIPAQGLGSALHQLAKERDVQLVYRSEVVGDLQTGGAVGQLTLDEALTRLLNGTDLTYQYIEDTAVTIVPLPPSRRADGKAQRKSGSLSALMTEHSSPGTENSSLWDRFRLAQAETRDDRTSTAGSIDDRSGPKRLTLEEVIVTAQKREERLQDVPISISVLKGEELDRSTVGVIEQLVRVPGIAQTDSSLGSKQLTVRGVSSTSEAFAGTSTVGYYLDSVPFGFVRQAFVPDANAYDLERVEVLRGPQGTLYGVSAVNGVVRILTADPDLNEFQTKARATLSSTEDGGDGYRGDGAVNIPIVSGKLAARAVVSYDDRPAWIDGPVAQDINGGENLTARLKLKAALTEDFSATAMLWHSKTDFAGRPLSFQDRSTIIPISEHGTDEYDIYALRLEYDLEAFTLTSSTSYLDYRNFSGQTTPLGGTALLFTTLTSRNISQEISLNSTTSGPLRWSLGGIYRDVADSVAQNIPGVFPNPRGLKYNDYSKSYAVFGELIWSLTDELEVVGGLRYFKDDNEVRQIENVSNPNAILINNSEEFDSVSPRVVLNWRPSPSLTVYTSYAEGFRSGFSQSPSVLGVDPNFPGVGPDNLTNYEVGAKADVADGRVSFESAVFFIDWQDVQQSIAVPTAIPGVPQLSALINGESASGVGAEFMLTIRPVSNLELGATYSWNSLEFDADVFTLIAGTNTLLAPEGSRLASSPEHTASAFFDYRFPLGGLEGNISGSVNYVSSRFNRGVAAGAVYTNTADDITMARASVGVSSAAANWGASLFVDNLTDFKGSTAPFINFPDTAYRSRPRTIGLQLDYRFGR